MLRNIPAHDCRNCGACCGPTMASENEIELIKKYIAGMDKVYRKKLKGQKKGILDCPYRDEERKRCAIYPVRPTVCRLMGVVKGMECMYGNSANIDGGKFLDRTQRHRLLPNFLVNVQI